MVIRILLLLFVVSFSSIAQDSLILLNGKVKVGKIDTLDYSFVYYQKVKKNGELGTKRKKNLDHVFSVNKKGQDVSYIYQQDSILDNNFTIVEMDYYLQGRRQAKKYFKPYKTLLIGAAVGTGVAMYSLFPIKYGKKYKYQAVLDTVTNLSDTLNMAVSNALTIPVPLWEMIPIGIYVYYQGAAKNTKKFKADNPELFNKRAFMVGYKETVIDRKVIAAAGASFGSFLTTILGYVIFDPPAD